MRWCLATLGGHANDGEGNMAMMGIAVVNIVVCVCVDGVDIVVCVRERSGRVVGWQVKGHHRRNQRW